MDRKAEFEETFEKNKDRYFSEWKEFLRFESISADPGYNQECTDCAEWLVEHLEKLGFESKLLKTPSKPVVFAERKGEPGKPVILFYGHYDVQPVDPIEKWETPPFEPTVRDGCMYARGAEDNKGQVMYFLKAVEALIKANALTSTLKIIIEGEEESGSEAINEGLQVWKDKLKSDILMVCDTDMLDREHPAITMGLRGIVHLELLVKGPRNDLHSGIHGGGVRNPATELARLIATLHDSNGKIAIDGYYDGVPPIDPEDRKLLNSAPITPEIYTKMTGSEPCGGEQEYSILERLGLRPTIEVNGMTSGYSGVGSKTIIPSFASAKVTARTVIGQDPDRCLKLIMDHLRAKTPKGVTLEIPVQAAAGKAVYVSSHLPVVKKSKKVLDELFNGKTVYLWCGASVPVIAALAETAGADPILVGFGLEDDLIHAPNEHFPLEQFKRGFLYTCLFLTSLAE